MKELVRLTAEEINRLPAEEAAALKAEKQAAMRDTLDAERKGTGDLKLAKLSNLSDLSDKNKARKNLEVYSKTEIDTMMAKQARYGLCLSRHCLHGRASG